MVLNSLSLIYDAVCVCGRTRGGNARAQTKSFYTKASFRASLWVFQGLDKHNSWDVPGNATSTRASHGSAVNFCTYRPHSCSIRTRTYRLDNMMTRIARRIISGGATINDQCIYYMAPTGHATNHSRCPWVQVLRLISVSQSESLIVLSVILFMTNISPSDENNQWSRLYMTHNRYTE